MTRTFSPGARCLISTRREGGGTRRGTTPGLAISVEAETNFGLNWPGVLNRSGGGGAAVEAAVGGGFAALVLWRLVGCGSSSSQPHASQCVRLASSVRSVQVVQARLAVTVKKEVIIL